MILIDMYVVYVVFFLQFLKIDSFNFDTTNPIVYVDPEKVHNVSISSYFGYSVVLYPRGDKWIKIGAPKGTDPKIPEFNNTGVVYNCPYMRECDRVDVHNGRQEYGELLNHAWIGGTMDIHYNFDRLVICAFRKVYQVATDYRTVGSCYLSYLNSTYDKEEPLENKKNAVYQGKVYNYGQGEAGFSAHFPKKENELILGAPGVFNWAGTTIQIVDNIYEDPIASRFTNRRRRGLQRAVNVADASQSSVSYSYELFGYAVNSGYFYGSNVSYYVASTPKSNTYKGKVVIFKFNGDKPLIPKEAIVGYQLGEYFGASIAVGHINNDTYEDLIIGAPYHAVDTFNEGSVYIFLGQERTGLKKYDVLYGQQTNGQFGSSLMYLGDIDRDGYGDLAIGAPYEDDFSGVVYIYKGNKQGLEKQPCQRIRGKDISSEIRGFGISISRPADMDGNGYMDLAVGAHLSANAVLLRSSPVIVIKYEMETFPKVLKTEESKDFILQTCFSYTHYKEINIVIKKTLIIDELIGRATIKNQSDNVTITSEEWKCENITISLLSPKNGTMNKDVPLTVSLSYELARKPPKKEVIYISENITGDDNFCMRCPILDELRSTRPDTMRIPFTLDCGDDNICQSDLSIEAVIPSLGEKNTFVLGSMNYVKLLTTVRNYGEKAYSTQLEVILPDSIYFREIPSACNQLNVSVILCNVDNPLIKQKSVNLELDMKDVKNSFKTELNIRLRVLTTSNNSNTDTIFLLKLQLKREADVTIHGQASEQSVAFGNITHGMPNFTQIYQVEKIGASPLEKVLINITIPHTVLTPMGAINFIKLYQPIAVFNGQPVMCSSNFTYIQETKTVEVAEGLEVLIRTRRQAGNEDIASMKKQQRIEEITPNRTLFLNCNKTNIICSSVLCRGSFETRQTPTVIQIKMMFITSAIQGLLGTNDLVLYSTHGSVTIESPSGFVQNGARPDSVEVSSLFISEIVKKKKVALWIIIVSAIAGILLLVLIIFGLTKAGFFKRGKKEELMNLKAAIEEEKENEIQESNDDAFEPVATSSNEGLVEDDDNEK